MTDTLRKITALTLAFMLVFVSVFGSGSFVYAGGVEDEEGPTATGGTISGGEFYTKWEKDGYYPASFKYAIQNKRFKVTFEDGTTESVDGWHTNNGGTDGTDYAFEGFGSKTYDRYFMRFYEVDGEKVTQMKICDDEVPIGTFTVFITRNEEVAPITVEKITIIDPVEKAAAGNSASFTSSNASKFDETWYPISLTANQEYVFVAKDWMPDNGVAFSDIWVKDGDDAVFRLDDGFGYGAGSGDIFTYKAGGVEDAYLVIGEMNSGTDFSGKVEWNQKRTIASIQLQPAASYKAWNSDLATMPLKVTYTDGTTSVESGWYMAGFRPDGYVTGLQLKTSNADTISMGKFENGTWSNTSYANKWTPGTGNWRAYVETNKSIYDDATIKIADPAAKTLKLEAAYAEAFKVTATQDAAFLCTPTKTEKIEIVNNGSDDLYCYVFTKTDGSDAWQSSRTSLISAGRTQTMDFTDGESYLILLEGKGKTINGTIGLYSVGYAKTATIKKITMAPEEYDVWATLPITINFVGEDGTTAVGAQTITSWAADYAGGACGRTKYGETIYYKVFKGSTQVDIPILSEEVMQMLADQDSDEVRDMILQEFGFDGGMKGLELAPGTYTVKAYLHTKVIGEGTVEVVEPALPVCKTHKWNSGKVTKQATTKANGTKTFTCTACGETKKETIYKASTVKLSYTKTTYSGKVKSPTITIKDSKGKKISSTNYTVKKAAGRKNVGKYTYKVTFKNAYKGTKSLYLTINPKATSMTKKPTAAKKAFTVKWKKVSKQATGYEIMYSTSKKFTKSTSKTVKVTSYKTTSKKITKLKAKKTYYVKVRTYKTVSGKKYYSDWSSYKTVTTKK